MKYINSNLVIGLLAIILSTLPFIANLLIPVNPTRVNPYWDNWPYDYNYYLSIITQGKNGRFTTIDKYTSEHQSGKFLRTGYIVLGRLAKLLNLNETAVYHLARITLGALFVFFIYLFIKACLKQKKSMITIIYFLALFTAGYPEIICNPNCHPIPRLWSMTQLDPIRRLTFLPHFLWGQIAFINILLVFLSENRLFVWTVIASIILGVAGLDHPPSLFIIYPTLILSTLFLFLKKELTKDLFIKAILIIIITLPFVLYILNTTRSFPWNLTRKAVFPLEANFLLFCFAAGPTFIIGLISAILILFFSKKTSVAFIINASWLISVVILTFGVKLPELSAQTRFLQIDIRLPSAILTGYLLWELFNKINIVFSLRKMFVKMMIFLIIFLPTLPSLYLLYYDQFDYVIYFAKNYLPDIPYPPYIDYPPKDWMKGIYWLKNNSHPDEIVLSDFTAGNFIPAYAGNTVYYGHQTETANYYLKGQEITKFFNTKTVEEQKSFLIKNHISYIFYGSQEKSYRKSNLSISGISIVYKNPAVTIFKFNN